MYSILRLSSPTFDLWNIKQMHFENRIQHKIQHNYVAEDKVIKLFYLSYASYFMFLLSVEYIFFRSLVEFRLYLVFGMFPLY